MLSRFPAGGTSLLRLPCASRLTRLLHDLRRRSLAGATTAAPQATRHAAHDWCVQTPDLHAALRSLFHFATGREHAASQPSTRDVSTRSAVAAIAEPECPLVLQFVMHLSEALLSQRFPACGLQMALADDDIAETGCSVPLSSLCVARSAGRLALRLQPRALEFAVARLNSLLELQTAATTPQAAAR